MAKPRKIVEGVYERVPGSGIWYGRYRDADGKLVKRSFGEDHRKAKSWVEARRVERRASSGKETGRVAVCNVGDLCDDLLAYIKAHPDKYRDQNSPPTRIAALKAQFGDRKADSLRARDISDWLDHLKTKAVYPGRNKVRRNLAPATRNRYKTTLSSAYQLGKYNGKCDTNPCREVKSYKPHEGMIRFLTDTEEVRLRAALDSLKIQADRVRHYDEETITHHLCELDIALNTGMRKGEQYGLRWNEVDFERGEIALHRTKNDSGRLVLLNSVALSALRILKKLADKRDDRRDYVFANQDSKKWLSTALKLAKINSFRHHDFRHTFCSRLAMRGENLKVIAELAGHKTLQMTARYAHLDDTTKRRALEGLIH
jgi:integrase